MALPDLKILPTLANCIRALAMDAVEAANSGHPGMPMGMADVATVLYARHLKFYAHNPHWADRDRMILSGGHGSMLLYALSYLTGYEAMTLDEIKRFRQVGSRTPGHPEHDVAIGAEMTTGPLGQGIGAAVGFALAEKIQRDRFGGDLVNHRTYVLCGDGDMQEGISHEACALAGHMKLNNLIVLYDDNGISIDGPTSLSFTEDVCARYTAYGWATRKVNGHDMAEIDAAIEWAKMQDRPVLIACKTTIGFGAGEKAGTADCHGSPLGKDEIATARKNLNWPHDPFVIPDDLLNAWRAIGATGRDAYTAWEGHLAAADEARRQSFISDQNGISPYILDRVINVAIKDFMGDPTTEKEPITVATRKSSQLVLEYLITSFGNLIGGSADLTGSNLTKTNSHTHHPDPASYIYYGVREHGMAAIMNGMSLHGGIVPYGGTFLCFADYMRPSMRLAALMGAQVVYVMTHDSIGLGEDGPTHQPVEHLASLRAMPNMHVFRPADAVETAICWGQALKNKTGPSVLALSRQSTSPIRMNDRTHTAYGAYIVRNDDNPRVIIFATGSEVDLALDTAAHLSGMNVRVVSVPSFEIFRAQNDDYKRAILGHDLTRTPVRVGIEAAIRQGWDEIIGSDGLFFGMSTFGASGPAKKLYAHFGLTPDAIAAAILKVI